MRSLWRGIVRTLFWSYERGSWPYDVMVIAIVAFVLLTPRSWFRDQPQTNTAESLGVHFLSQDDQRLTTSFRIDASLLRPDKRTPKPTPELERETHDILSRNVDSLRGQTFQVVRIDPVLASDGTVLSYDVTTHP
ncbi:MAG TPA: hypothetical protein VMU43_14470 [Candidatus Acidoferrum sp.]|nr:hypothetical protein [Candidatus Acidoferrum sp.]